MPAGLSDTGELYCANRFVSERLGKRVTTRRDEEGFEFPGKPGVPRSGS
jgi:hypothetical protein